VVDPDVVAVREHENRFPALPVLARASERRIRATLRLSRDTTWRDRGSTDVVRRRKPKQMNDLETLFRAGALGQLTDGELLWRFLEGQDAAFEVLVTRHGPMVMRVCQRVLDDSHDAEDAFQATFLVLARRAGSIRRRDSVSSWLFGTATRVASRARSDAARRRRHERRGAAMTVEGTGGGPRDGDDLAPIVREEVANLPEKYRAAVVLCDLMGRGYEEAARVLGCPLGTLKARLSRARARLRERLIRRGLANLAVLPPAAVATREAAVPVALAMGTARAAATYGTGRATTLASGTVSARVVSLSERMVSSMFLTRLKFLAASALALGVSATAVALVTPSGPAVTGPAPQPPRPEAPADPGTLVRTPDDAARQALAVARSLPDLAERAEALLKLGRAAARRGEVATAKMTLLLAVQAADSIPPNTPYTFPHPIIRIAEAQAELGEDETARRTFRAAADVIGAEDDQHQTQNWPNLVHYQLRALGRVAPETVTGYRRYLERGPVRSPEYVVPILLRLQAASGGSNGALRAVVEGEEFAGPAKASLRKAALLGILGSLTRGDPAAAEVLAEAKKAVAEQVAPALGRDRRTQDLLALAKAEARLGRFADAVASAGSPRVTDDGDKFNQAQTFVEIAMAQARAGDKAGAAASARRTIAIVDPIRQENYKTYPLYQAGEAFVEAGELAEARRLAGTIKPRYRSLLWIKIAEASRAAGDDAAALADLKQALRASEENRAQAAKRPPTALGGPKPPPVPQGKPDPRIRAAASETVQHARLQARLGDLPAALRTIATIDEPEGREEALIALAAARAGEGDLGSARDLVARIESPEARGKAWISIACALPARKASEQGPSAAHR
jgi:RNA polymerase sigma factor (sigma-70 family)